MTIDSEKVEQYAAHFEGLTRDSTVLENYRASVSLTTLRHVATLLREQQEEIAQWREHWDSMRYEILRGVYDLNNDQINAVLGIIDDYEPESTALSENDDG